MRLLSLRTRIILLLSALVVINCAGAVVALWHSHYTQNLYTSVVKKDLAALTAAQDLETALIMQKGYTTYYFLNQDPKWLDQLAVYHHEFETLLVEAGKTAHSEEAWGILFSIQSAYLQFVKARDTVIDDYKHSRLEQGATLHWQVREQFQSIYDLCEAYKNLHQDSISLTYAQYGRRVNMVTAATWGAIPLSTLFSGLLAGVLFLQVLNPIRRLAMNATHSKDPVDNEIRVLADRVQDLIADVDTVQDKLQQSRKHLLQSEKMAVVGKLAAGVAHSIRNPLTSVKMRLFSLERSLSLDTNQKEDFDVVSEEVANIDHIVRSFLEFARRPKLKKGLMSPSRVVDTALTLLKHRLESCQVRTVLDRSKDLPEMEVDPEQLKEVLVNLLINGCEAAKVGGEITIREELGEDEKLGLVALIHVRDSGPGIPDSLRDKVFEPFFSTKEEGSGLGLSIARRIMEEHGGTIGFEEPEMNRGAGFVLALPL